jgi:hypothetical protein
MYICLYRSGHYTCFILAYFPYFENIEVGLYDNLAVCVHMCVGDLFIMIYSFKYQQFYGSIEKFVH